VAEKNGCCPQDSSQSGEGLGSWDRGGGSGRAWQRASPVQEAQGQNRRGNLHGRRARVGGKRDISKRAFLKKKKKKCSRWRKKERGSVLFRKTKGGGKQKKEANPPVGGCGARGRSFQDERREERTLHRGKTGPKKKDRFLSGVYNWLKENGKGESGPQKLRGGTFSQNSANKRRVRARENPRKGELSQRGQTKPCRTNRQSFLGKRVPPVTDESTLGRRVKRGKIDSSKRGKGGGPNVQMKRLS